MILIGESINVMSKTLGAAMKERNPEPIQTMAKAETEAGADYLDINIGPARKAGDELMEWIVNTVQEVTNLPLSLDTTNPAAMEAGLKAHRNGQALINSVSLARMDEELPLVKKYDAAMVGLLWGREGMPRDADERAVIASELMMAANQIGIPNEAIWFDPIVTPVTNVDTNQILPCLEFMSQLADIVPGGNSTVGLSNISNGAPNELRPILNRTYLIMLMKYGLYSAIVDVFDTELVKIVRGEMPEIVQLVHRVMDGEEADLSTLSKKEVDYVKTTRVLMGKSLYSHSWLKI